MRTERESRAASKAAPQPGAKAPGQASAVGHDEIARRAYQMYEQRGATDGHDVEDWLQAEQELAHERQPERQPTARPKLAEPSEAA